MNSVPIAKLRAEFMEGYVPRQKGQAFVPGQRAKSTCKLMNQSMRELHEDELLRETTDLSPAVLWRWTRRHPKGPATTAVHLRNIRTYCRYAVGRGWLANCPFTYDSKLKKMVSVKKESKQRHHSMEDIAKVLDHLRRHSIEGWAEHRLYALASLVAYTGVRAKEAQYAEVKDISFKDACFHVNHKEIHRLKTDLSERYVPIAPALAPVLRNWIEVCDSKWAFPGKRKMCPWVNGSSGEKPLDKLKAAGKAVGVEGFTFLSLRHSFITLGKLLFNLNETQIQQIAGHTTTATQKNYLGRDLPLLQLAMAPMIYSLTPLSLPTEGQMHGTERPKTFRRA